MNVPLPYECACGWRFVVGVDAAAAPLAEGWRRTLRIVAAALGADYADGDAALTCPRCGRVHVPEPWAVPAARAAARP